MHLEMNAETPFFLDKYWNFMLDFSSEEISQTEVLSGWRLNKHQTITLRNTATLDLNQYMFMVNIH